MTSQIFKVLTFCAIILTSTSSTPNYAVAASSIVAMKAVSGMANPLLEASLVRTGSRLAFRHCGAMVDPIRRQLLFDFERLEEQRGRPSAISEPAPLRR